MRYGQTYQLTTNQPRDIRFSRDAWLSLDASGKIQPNGKETKIKNFDEYILCWKSILPLTSNRQTQRKFFIDAFFRLTRKARDVICV